MSEPSVEVPGGESIRPSPAPVVPRGATALPWTGLDPADLRRAQAGDADALGRFFDHYLDQLYRLARRFVDSAESAQDLTQEIFLKLRRNLGRLNVEHDPAPWLFTVAINVCRDHRRSAAWHRSKRSISLSDGAQALELTDEAADPQRLFAAAEERRRVQDAILKLPADQFMSVVLHDFEGFSHEQIAQLAGIEHAAARKRHSRALRTLERLLGEEGWS